MKFQTLFALTIFVATNYSVNAKSQKEEFIETAFQFQRWCKTLSYRLFRQKKLNPYNWSASTIRQLNDYQTKGSWKVNKQEIHVYCQIRKGKKAKYTKIDILTEN